MTWISCDLESMSWTLSTDEHCFVVGSWMFWSSGLSSAHRAATHVETGHISYFDSLAHFVVVAPEQACLG